MSTVCCGQKPTITSFAGLRMGVAMGATKEAIAKGDPFFLGQY
jgi:hypothetical protein